MWRDNFKGSYSLSSDESRGANIQFRRRRMRRVACQAASGRHTNRRDQIEMQGQRDRKGRWSHAHKTPRHTCKLSGNTLIQPSGHASPRLQRSTVPTVQHAACIMTRWVRLVSRSRGAHALAPGRPSGVSGLRRHHQRGDAGLVALAASPLLCWCASGAVAGAAHRKASGGGRVRVGGPPMRPRRLAHAPHAADAIVLSRIAQLTSRQPLQLAT